MLHEGPRPRSGSEVRFLGRGARCRRCTSRLLSRSIYGNSGTNSKAQITSGQQKLYALTGHSNKFRADLLKSRPCCYFLPPGYGILRRMGSGGPTADASVFFWEGTYGILQKSNTCHSLGTVKAMANRGPSRGLAANPLTRNCSMAHLDSFLR